jgi:hypothetical protein
MNLEGKYHVFGPIGMKALIFTPDLGLRAGKVDRLVPAPHLPLDAFQISA